MNAGSIETALVSRLTQDIEDLRQDKEYLRADVVRLQAELDRERAETERRARELEELLERVQKGNSVSLPGDAHRGSVKLEQCASKPTGTLRKSPSLEIIGFKEPPSPPHSLIDGDVDEPMEESKPTVNEGEVDYENQDPNFAHLGDENAQLSADNIANENRLDSADTSYSVPLQNAEGDMGTGSEDVDDDKEPDDHPPQPSDKALGKRKVPDNSTTLSPSSKKPRTSQLPSKSGIAPLLPLHPPPIPVPHLGALGGPLLSNTTNSSNASLNHQRDVPPSSLDAEAFSPSFPAPIPPLPFRPRATIGVGAFSLSVVPVAPAPLPASAAAPVPPLPFRPRPVRNFKIKEEEAVILPVDIVANYLQDVPPFSINPDPSGVLFISRKFLAKVYGGSDRQFLQYIEVPLLSNSSRSSTSEPSSSTTTSTSVTSISTTRRRRKPLMFPTPEMNPSMPLFPGDPGLIFTSRTEILKDGPWSVFRKYDRGIDVEVKREGESGSNDAMRKEDGKPNRKGKGKLKSVVWVYVGDYECTKAGKISRDEWGAQNKEVKKRWANRVATKMTGCYLSMRARIGLRKAGIIPSSSSTSTSDSNEPSPPSASTSSPIRNPPTDTTSHDDLTRANIPSSSSRTPSSLPSVSVASTESSSSTPTSTPDQDQDQDQANEDDDADADSRYERLRQKEISAHRSRKPLYPVTERDILEAFERGEEGVDIVQLKCVAYDWEWVRDFEGRWERGQRAKWWEADGVDDGEGEEMGDGRDGTSGKNKRRQRVGRTQSTSSVGARRRSSRTIKNARGKGQAQVDQDVGAGGTLSVNEPVDDRGEVTTAVALLPSSQIPSQPVPSLRPDGPPTRSSSIPMPTTPTSPALRGQTSLQKAMAPVRLLNSASEVTQMNSGTTGSNSGLDEGGGGGGVGDIDDGYLSYLSEAEMEMGDGNLDDLSDFTDLEDGDDA